MTWRVANSLLELRNQINVAYPTRNKASDGTIGDPAHAKTQSDHNPWIKDKGIGVVTALDITHDPKSGCDGMALAEALRKSRDPRIKYVIFNKQIFSSTTQPWVWRKYTGSNPHSTHVHISVNTGKPHYDHPELWNLTGFC